MSAVVFEHVPIADLPEHWRARLAGADDEFVTVRIEAEAPTGNDTLPAEELPDNPLFGMWRDREDMVDVAGYIRKLRADRFNGGEARNPG